MSKKPSMTGAEITAEHLGDSFLRIAKYFREIQDFAPEKFEEVAKLVGISRRRAFYFAKIDRAFTSLGIDENRLCAIGWTKLTLLADHITATNRDQLLDLAEECTVRELSVLMRDGVPADGERCVLLYFEPPAYELFEQAVLAFGGKKVGRGLVNKEAALAKALVKSLDV